MQRRGKTFIVSGPSGVGKSTVLKALFDQRTDLYFSISATTRDPRPGEVDGVHYHFIPAEEFHRMVEEDEFLEYAEYVGNFYGTPKKYVDRAMDDGRDVILDIEIQGANQICTKRPETVRIFIAPPSWVELERRLRPWHRQSGGHPEPPAASQGGAADCQQLRLSGHQRYRGAGGGGDGGHSVRRALPPGGASGAAPA